jgi:protein phosphatase
MRTTDIASDIALLEPAMTDTLDLPDTNSFTVRSFGLTDVGKVRKANEDQFLIAVLRKALRIKQTSLPLPVVQQSSDRSYLFVVADGMGGHAGGEKASALAIDSVETFMLEAFHWCFQFKGKEQDNILAEFQTALSHANARVLTEAAAHPELRGMGTTLTLAYSVDDQLFVAHVGDSRCYLFRNAVLNRLTSDHTLVEDMVRVGALRAEEAVKHHWRHVVTNAVGGNTDDVKVELHKVQLAAGDEVLLCSDGLTEMLRDQEIASIMKDEGEPEAACRRLVVRANEAGGRDNITVIIAQYQASL